MGGDFHVSLERKGKISAAVLVLLKDLEGEAEVILAVSLLQAFTEGRNKSGKKKTSSKKAAPRTQSKETVPTKPKNEDSKKQPEKGSTEDQTISIDEFLKEEFWPFSDQCWKAIRQEGASQPRMDHKSIRARWRILRKKLNKTMKELSEVETDKLQADLINQIKSVNVQLADSYMGGVRDLPPLTNIPSKRNAEAALRSLLAKGYQFNDHTGFIEPGAGSQQATKPVAKANPFLPSTRGGKAGGLRWSSAAEAVVKPPPPPKELGNLPNTSTEPNPRTVT